jgi:hypothetical protein
VGVEYAANVLTIFPKIIGPKNNFPKIFFVPYFGGDIRRKIKYFFENALGREYSDATVLGV